MATTLHGKRSIAGVEDLDCLGNIVCTGWQVDASRIKIGSLIPNIDALSFVGRRVGKQARIRCGATELGTGTPNPISYQKVSASNVDVPAAAEPAHRKAGRTSEDSMVPRKDLIVKRLAVGEIDERWL